MFKNVFHAKYLASYICEIHFLYPPRIRLVQSTFPIGRYLSSNQKYRMPMEVITMASEAFKSLETKIDRIAVFVEKAESGLQNKDPDLSGIKLSTEEICDILDISPRTLQRLRKDGRIFYYIEKGKCIYKFEDIEQLVNDKVLPTCIQSISEFRKAYIEYVK